MQQAGANNYSFVTSGYKLTDKELDKSCSAAIIIEEKTDLIICASVGLLTYTMAAILIMAIVVGMAYLFCGN